MSNPRRRALARLSSPWHRTDDTLQADPRRRALSRRLIARADDPSRRRSRRALGAPAVVLRESVTVRALRVIQTGAPAPLLIRLVRRPFALKTARPVRRPALDPAPEGDRAHARPARARAPRSSELTGSRVRELRSAAALRAPERPRPERERPTRRRAARAPEPVRFDADPEEVVP